MESAKESADMAHGIVNLAELIEREFEDDEIEAVVIGNEEDYSPDPSLIGTPMFEVLTWGQARAWLDYSFDSMSGYACTPVYVWGKKNIMFLTQYDGQVGPYTIPRNPIECHPGKPGG